MDKKVRRLDDVPAEEFPLRFLTVRSGAPNPGQGEEHTFIMLRAGTGFIHFATNETRKEPELPAAFMILQEESTGTGIIPEEQRKTLNPYSILMGIEFPDEDSFDIFIDALQSTKAKLFPKD